MSVDNKQRKIPPTPDAATPDTTTVETVNISTEAPEKTAHGIVLRFCVEKNILTLPESNLVSPAKVDELIVRTAHEYESLPDEIPQQHIDKVRRILGLKPNLGAGIVESTERAQEIKKVTTEMRVYLEQFRIECPEVLGMILCGSRIDPDKLPAPDSDVDAVLILRESTVTDPHTAQGEALLCRLKAFSDNTPSSSGFSVELDELYSVDDLFSKLQDPTDKSKLTWGWNPQIVKYIGDNIGNLDELGMQIKILEDLNHPEMLKLKQQKIAEAKELIIRYLGSSDI